VTVSRPAAVQVLALAVAALLAGCGRGAPPTAPAPARDAPARGAPAARAGAGFFPLAPGTSWTYADVEVHTRAAQGETLVTRRSWTRTDSIAGTRVLGGIVYAVMVARADDLPYGGESLMRQDRRGLWESAGDDGSAERLVLPYPLHVGAAWQWDAFACEVERLDLLDTPAGRFPGWCVVTRIPNEDGAAVLRNWFGRCGRLGANIVSHREYVDRDSGIRIVVDDVTNERLIRVSFGPD
jgi:hypothetical protein